MKHYMKMLFILAPAFSAQTYAMDCDSDDEGKADRIVVHAPQYEAKRASIEYAINVSNIQFTSAFFDKHPEYINTVNCMGRTVLHTLAQLPCEQQAVDVIEKLLQENRLDLSAKSAEGRTPATCAYDVGNKRVCELLYKYGASDPETIMQEFVILDFDDGAAQDATIE